MLQNYTDVIFSTELSLSTTEPFVNEYITHALCESGNGNFMMSGKKFEIKEGDFIIFVNANFVSNFRFSADFRASILYVSKIFIANNYPESNYDVVGAMGLFENPIMQLDEYEKQICKEDILLIKNRLEYKSHFFYKEMIGQLAKSFFLDLFHIHSQKYKGKPISDRKSSIFREFINLLEKKEYYIKERSINFYASKLAVTPKYLSKISVEITGQSAQYWIERFTIIRILQLMRERKYSNSQISEILNFSSVSYFSRYVKRILGVSPSDFLDKED